LARCFSNSVSKRFFFQFAFDLGKIIGTMLESGRGPSLRLKNISLSSGTQVFKALADESRLRTTYRPKVRTNTATQARPTLNIGILRKFFNRQPLF
jgi:hypothetical protein